MKLGSIDLLRCARCGAALELGAGSREQAGEIVSGQLICTSCRHASEISGGLPVLLPDARVRDLTQESFGQQWAWRQSGKFEADGLYGKSAAEEYHAFLRAFAIASPDQLAGKRILDAGCGCARLDVHLARAVPSATVVGVDFSDSARDAYESSKGISNLHILQGDLLRPPFAPGTFDYVWSEGVLHHLPDSKAGFDALSPLVAPGGHLYVWVYYSGKKSPFRMARSLLLKPYLLPPPALYAISWAFAVPLYGLNVLRKFKGKYDMRQLVFLFYDTLSPEFCHTHSREEVRDWFAAQRYEDIVIAANVGVRGRKPRA